MRLDRRKSKKYKKAYELKYKKGIALKLTAGIIIIMGFVFTPYPTIDHSNIINEKSAIDYTFPKTGKPLSNEFTNYSSNEYSSVASSDYQSPNSEKETVDTPDAVDQDIPEVYLQDVVEKIGLVALSYDDGPHRTITPGILQILNENEVYATFFVLGNKIKKHDDIIYQIHSEGHEIGNHGYDHTSFDKLSLSQIQKQIVTTSDYIFNIIGERPSLVRPPYGTLNRGYTHQIDNPIILWSIDSDDWRDFSIESITEHVLSNLEDGSIILFHDTHQKTLEISKLIIPQIKKLGYDIVPVGRLFELNEVALENGKVYRKIKK